MKKISSKFLDITMLMVRWIVFLFVGSIIYIPEFNREYDKLIKSREDDIWTKVSIMLIVWYFVLILNTFIWLLCIFLIVN